MKVIIWVLKHPRATFEMLGYIPTFLDSNDPRDAQTQLDANYQHGGGFSPMPGFRMSASGLLYPGDPPLPLLAECRLRNEVVRFYDCSFVAVVQPDGSFVAARMD